MLIGGSILSLEMKGDLLGRDEPPARPRVLSAPAPAIQLFPAPPASSRPAQAPNIASSRRLCRKNVSHHIAAAHSQSSTAKRSQGMEGGDGKQELRSWATSPRRSCPQPALWMDGLGLRTCRFREPPWILSQGNRLLHTERPAGLLTCSLQLPSSVRDSLSIYRREPSKLAALMAFYGKNSTPPPTATGMPSL